MQVIVFLSDIIESQFTMLHGEAVITQSGEPGVWAVGGGGLQGWADWDMSRMAPYVGTGGRKSFIYSVLEAVFTFFHFIIF